MMMESSPLFMIKEKEQEEEEEQNSGQQLLNGTASSPLNSSFSIRNPSIKTRTALLKTAYSSAADPNKQTITTPTSAQACWEAFTGFFSPKKGS
jgi:hypothetical protein